MSYKICFQYLHEDHRYRKPLHGVGEDSFTRRSSRTWAKDKVVARRYERRSTKLFVAREIGIDDEQAAREFERMEKIYCEWCREIDEDNRRELDRECAINDILNLYDDLLDDPEDDRLLVEWLMEHS